MGSSTKEVLTPFGIKKGDLERESGVDALRSNLLYDAVMAKVF
jgi:hypothetical protein